MLILAFDLGTTTGAAWLAADGRIWSETWRLAPRPKTPWGRRLMSFRDALPTRTPPDVVVYERVRRHVSAGSAHAYGALRGVLLLWAYEQVVTVATVEVAEWKNAAGLPGNAGKEEVAEEIARRWGAENLGQDEGEARLMALCYRART